MINSTNCLQVQNIYKNYEGKPLLEGISLEVRSGELLCLLGRSGSGKSTLLRIIAGIETPDGGKILWNGEDQAGIPVHQRQFGLMFQDYALFPHLNVEENVAFGLKMQRLDRAAIQKRVRDALIQVNMVDFTHRRVTDLSGGEQQRVALARALAPQPRLLMLDEPLAALDRTLREQLGEELRILLESTGIPVIYVTHDQEEALALSDRLALLHDGRIVQSGKAQEVFSHPVSPWAAEFLGMKNLLVGKVISTSPLKVNTAVGAFNPVDDSTHTLGESGHLLIKPYGCSVIDRSSGDDQVTGEVLACSFQGSHYRIRLDCSTGIVLDFETDAPFEVGRTLVLSVPHSSLVWIGDQS